MKLKLFIAATISLLILGGCTKEGITTVTPVTSGTPVTPVTANTWKLGTTEFTTASSFKIDATPGNQAQFSGSDKAPGGSAGLGNFWVVYFKTLPTVNSTFRVVVPPNLASTEVWIAAKRDGVPNGWYSTGVGAIDVKVTFTGGKMTVVVPDIPMTQDGTTATATTFSGTLKEM